MSDEGSDGGSSVLVHITAGTVRIGDEGASLGPRSPSSGSVTKSDVRTESFCLLIFQSKVWFLVQVQEWVRRAFSERTPSGRLVKTLDWYGKVTKSGLGLQGT